MKSVMQHQFSRVPSAEIQRSQFDRSCGLKTAFDAGLLIPIFVDEVIPGDTLSLNANLFGRLATPKTPVMDNMYLDTFYFFVPMTILWEHWKNFMGEKVNPDDSTTYTVPQMTTTVALNSLSQYLGLPITTGNITFDCLVHRAYNKIWNDWFRHAFLQDSVVVDIDDAASDAADYVLLRRNKRHDYFTSCLPWPQASPAGADVMLPLGAEANIELVTTATDPMIVKTYDTKVAFQATRIGSEAATGFLEDRTGDVSGGNLVLDPNGNLIADLSTATSASINSIREAFQLQRLYERDARGGTRYYEMIKAHYGVVDPGNLVLQRPEYLGGGRQYVNVHPVAVTANTSTGVLGGFGTVSGSGNGFTKSFTQHGYIIGLACLTADLTYQQGIPRMYQRRTRFDFYFPGLSHLGEQAVLKSEIQGNHIAPTGVFGYQERHADYRYKPSQITSIFSSDAAGTLDSWHLSQDLATNVELNSTFIEENPPIDRVIATPTEPHMILDVYFNYKCARPMPVYSVPGMMDHF